MTKAKQILLISASAMAISGCFKKFKASQVNHSSIAGQSAAQINLLEPADQFNTQSSVPLRGTCTANLQMNISGDISALAQADCVNGEFSATVELSTGDGPKMIRLSQIGGNGLESAVSRIFIKDTEAPVVSVITPVAGQNVRSNVAVQGACEAGLEINILESGVNTKIPCAVGAFAATFPLASVDGNIALVISQTDAAGNRSQSSISLAKDNVAPVVSILSPAANSNVSSQASISGACETGLAVQVSGAGASAPATITCMANAYSIATVFTAGAGTKTIQVSQSDLSGNSTSVARSFVRQADAAPAITISAPAANSYFQNSVTLTGTCQTGLTVNFSGAGWMSPASTACSNGNFSAAVNFTNGDGGKNVIVAQTNAQGLTGSASRTFIRDLTAPAITIASPAANSLARTSIQLMGACENGRSVEISGADAASAGTASCANGIYSAAVALSAGEGNKSIQVTQTDAAGNSASASRIFIRDSVAPAVTIAAPAADTSAATGLTITGTCEGTYNVTASGSGLNAQATRPCAANSFSLDIVFSNGDGAKSVTISQTDAAGNTGSVSRNFVRTTPQPVIDGPALYAQNCAGCHGALATSAKQNRTALQISNAITGISQMTSLNFLSVAQREAIAAALYVAPTQPAFACDPNQGLPSKAVAKSMKRLSRRQYINTLNDLLERAFSATAARTLVNNALSGVSLPSDDHSNFSRFDSSVIRQHMKAYFDVSDTLATNLVSTANYSTFVSAFINLDRGTCTTVNPAALTSACATRFIANFGRRVLRRPLVSNAELNEPSVYMATYTGAGSNAAGINAVVFKLLLAPQFLYQVENDGALVSGTLYRISSHAVASRLSYMFWNSMPDENLLQQAQGQNLADDAPFMTALNYVVNSTRAEDSVREFMNEWLKLNDTPQFQPNNSSLNFLAEGLVLDSSLRSAMIEEVQELGSYVYRNNLTFNDLFSTDVSFARDPRLMNIYGVTTPAAALVTPANAVRLPAGQRSGLLTRGALLVGGSELANPIKRGIRIRRDILCLTLDAPPAELEDALQPPAPNVNMTTRQRYDNATSPAVCMNCHQHINSLGHGFSNFNSFGKFGNQEPTFDSMGTFSGRYLPINAQVDLSISLGGGLMARDPAELSMLVAAHRNTRLCVSEKALRFAEGRQVDRAKEGCRLNNLHEHLAQAHSLKDFLKSIAQDSEFRHRLIGN